MSLFISLLQKYKYMKKRQNAAARKPDILKNFLQVILDEGIEGASIGKVAKRMEIHPSLIIHYFENKDNMTEALVDYVMKEYAKLLIRLEMTTVDPEQRLLKLIEIVYSDEWYKMTDISVDFSVIAISFRNSRINARIREMYDQFKKVLIREFQPMIAGKIISIHDPSTAAEIVISMVEGYRHFKHFYVDEVSSERFRNEMVKTVLTALMN